MGGHIAQRVIGFEIAAHPIEEGAQAVDGGETAGAGGQILQRLRPVEPLGRGAARHPVVVEAGHLRRAAGQVLRRGERVEGDAVGVGVLHQAIEEPRRVLVGAVQVGGADPQGEAGELALPDAEQVLARLLERPPLTTNTALRPGRPAKESTSCPRAPRVARTSASPFWE